MERGTQRPCLLIEAPGSGFRRNDGLEAVAS